MFCAKGPSADRRLSSRVRRSRQYHIRLRRSRAAEGAAAEAHAVDLQVLQDALDIVARLRERYALDPVDRIDARIARVAVALDPLLHAAGPGIVAREGEDVGAEVTLDVVSEFGCAQLNVVDVVVQQPALVERHAELLGDV